MPKLPVTKRKACIVVVLTAFLVIYLLVLRRTDSGNDASEITSGPGERFFKLTERLVETGVDVNAKNSHGSTPLHYAFIHLPEFGPQLLECNANPTITSNDGKSVLDMLSSIEAYLPSDKIRHDEALLRYSAFVDQLRNFRQ